MSRDRVFHDGVWWLANNFGAEPPIDAVRLLSYIADTTDEIVIQAVVIQANGMASVQDMTILGDRHDR